MFIVPGPLDFRLFDESVMVKNNQRNFFILIFLCVNNVNERVNVGEVGGKIQRKSHPGLVVCHFLLPVVIRSITGTLEVASWRTLLFLPVLLASPPPTPAIP